MKLWKFEIKRVENTVWDYVVPLGLVVIAFIYFSYYRWNCFDCSLTRRISTPEDLYPVLITGAIVTSILGISSIYLTRFRRVLLAILFIGVVIFLNIRLKGTGYYLDFVDLIGISFFLALAFGMGNLSIYTKIGGAGIKLQGLLRSSLGWGIFGFGLHGATGALGCPSVGQLFCATYIAKYDILTRVLHYTQYDEFPNHFFLFATGYLTNFLLFFIYGLILETAAGHIWGERN
jgi:hypothetical protein